MPTDSRDRFFALLRAAVAHATLVKLTLGKPCCADLTLRNVFIRPVALKNGPHLSFVHRHDTRDVTKNLPPAEALALIEKLLGADFRDAHLFTATHSAQLALAENDTARLRIKETPAGESRKRTEPDGHDRARTRFISPDAPWLRALGVTNDRGRPREGMAAKFRQINKFVELLSHLLIEAGLLPAPQPLDAAFRASSDASPPAVSAPVPAPLRIADMGSGKGYLTFATAAFLGARAEVIGIETRPELVELCNRLARENALANLRFAAGTIADTPLDACDVLIALHACDTATDDALARGLVAGAKVIVVSPCCQKELRPQLTAPPVLADALRHGIFQERHAEFVTDALRAQLLEWAGYKTKVFEFVSTGHTAKNLMIAAIQARPRAAAADAENLHAFARFYGIRDHRLAQHLGLALGAPAAAPDKNFR
jgi:SAM-dependent methyltransferase